MIIGLVVEGTFNDNLSRQAYRLQLQQTYGLLPLTMDQALERLQQKNLAPNKSDIVVELLDVNDAIVFKAINPQHKILGITSTTTWVGSEMSKLCDYIVFHTGTIDKLYEDINDAMINLSVKVGYVSTKIRRGITRNT